jgi:hypothetical protein
VFNAALYRFATTGEASSVFSIEDLNGSFRPKKGFFGKDVSGSARDGMGSGLPPAPTQDIPPTRPDAG